MVKVGDNVTFIGPNGVSHTAIVREVLLGMARVEGDSYVGWRCINRLSTSTLELCRRWEWVICEAVRYGHITPMQYAAAAWFLENKICMLMGLGPLAERS